MLSTKDMEWRHTRTMRDAWTEVAGPSWSAFMFVRCYLALTIATLMLLCFLNAWTMSLKIGGDLQILSQQLLPNHPRASSLLVGFVETAIMITRCAIPMLMFLTVASMIWYEHPEWAWNHWDGQFWSYHDWKSHFKSAILGMKENFKTAIFEIKENFKDLWHQLS